MLLPQIPLSQFLKYFFPLTVFKNYSSIDDKCHTAMFFPRDAMLKRGLCCRPVSVRPSVTLVHCIQRDADIVTFLCGPGSPVILVFDLQR